MSRHYQIAAMMLWAVWGLSSSTQGQAPKELDGLPLVFEDGFEADAEHWKFTDPQAWQLKSETLAGQKNSYLSLTKRISDYQPKVRSPHNIALLKEVALADVIITFRVRSTADTGGHRDCCVFFGYSDPEHFYYVHAGAVPDPHSGQIMIVNGQPRVALTKNENKIPWDDQWHNIKLVRKSSGEIAIYFDDMQKPVMQVSDATFSKGQIGIGSFDDMNDFDDVAVYGR